MFTSSSWPVLNLHSVNVPSVLSNIWGSSSAVVKAAKSGIEDVQEVPSRNILQPFYNPFFNAQLTGQTTWLAAMGPGQVKNMSSSPPWRSRPKECWLAAPTTSSPSSPMMTNTIIFPGSGASLSRRTGKTEFPFAILHQRLPLLCTSFFLLLSFHFFLSGLCVDLRICSLRPSVPHPPPYLPALTVSFHFSKFQSLPHSSRSNLVCTQPVC